MRTLSTNAATQVNTALGTKPRILLEVSWVDSTPVSKYADKVIGAYSGKILSISSIDETIKVTGGSNSAQVSIILDDIDGTLKTIIDTHDIHKRPCWIYQLFDGLDPDADKFLLMRGEINSPIMWDEGARQLSFNAVTKVEATEIGFSIEEGQFPLLPIDLVGKAWPLAFGSVVNVPALRITSPREGILADGFGIHDYTLRRRIQLAAAICCPPNSIIGYNNTFGTNPTGGVVANTNPNTGYPSNTTGSFGISQTGFIRPQDPGFQYSNPFGYVIQDGVGAVSGGGGVVNGTAANGTGTGVSAVPIYGPDPNCLKTRCETVEQLQFDLDQQQKFEFPTIKVFNGAQFEQNKLITLSIGGAYVTGKFSGETFTVAKRIHKDTITKDVALAKNWTDPPTAAEISFILGQAPNRPAVMPDFGTNNPDDATAAYFAVLNQGPGTIGSACTDGVYKDVTDCQSDSMNSLNLYPTAGFQWINAGSKVTYAYDEEIVYIANILPSTVKCVAAYRTLDNGERLLLVVPSDYYTIRTTNYGAYQVVEVVMTRALSLQGAGWEDNLYVTLDSSVGPNTVDIIEWLITTYTSFGVDATSFAAVEAAIDNYPSHFAMLSRKNILTALDEISFQARCALYLRDNTFYIKYLSKAPTTVDTITEDHILQNTLKVTSTATETLVTKFIATWNDDYALQPKLLILRNNINKYGTHEQTYDFYIYNMYQLVEKSALFWLIRKSNTFRTATFSTPLVKLPLESFDDVILNIPDMGDATFRAQIDSAVYNSDTNQIDFTVWTPILGGSRVEYPWAYPGSVDPGQLWPPDVVAQGIGFGVIAPVGHPLSSSTFPQNVPDDVTAPNFQVSSCGGPPNSNTNFCCSSTATTQPSEFCQLQHPRRVDDANDKKPLPRTTISCPGAVNLGVDPVFAQQQPHLKAIQKTANQALATAASAVAKSLSAGGGAGGGGSAGGGGAGGGEDPHRPNRSKDTYSKLPKKVDNPTQSGKPGSGGPADPKTCTTLVTICWFPLVHGPDGPFADICFSGGLTRCETHTFGGCRGSTKTVIDDATLAAATAAGNAKQAAMDALNNAAAHPGDAGLQATADAAVAASTAADAAYKASSQREGDCEAFLKLLVSKGASTDLTGGASTVEICPSSDDTGICCNGTVQVTECVTGPGGCAPGKNDGKWMNVVKTGHLDQPAEFSSITEDGKGGDRGDGGGDPSSVNDAALGITGI